ncbi:MAG: hypothetical protein JWL70_2652, partial [Acidimicrobiia bacterium]|nr:hypothetical protein [Acidimicrobiia bacterium]
SIPWPEEAGAQLWLGMHALREFRGDGHVAVLAAEGVSGLEATVLQVAYRKMPPELLRTSRSWPNAQWNYTVDELRRRGLLMAEELSLSESGLAYRRSLEARTHDLALPAFRSIGAEGMARIIELAPAFVAAVTTVAGHLTRDQITVAIDD